MTWIDSAPDFVPADQPVTIGLTVHGGQDHPTAVLAARLAPLLVEAYRHFDGLGELASTDRDYLYAQLDKLAGITRGLQEHLIVTAREQGGASWADLGTLLGVDRQSAKDRYQRIKAASARGLTADAADRRADHHHI